MSLSKISPAIRVGLAFFAFVVTAVGVGYGVGPARLWLVSGASASANITPSGNAVPAFFTLGTCDTAGPIEIESSGGTTTPTAYSNLTAAFAAINAGTHTGSVAIEVCGNSDELAATAVLNASGSGSASYTDVSIKPVGGSARTITGATTPGSPMIDFNGADNVTVDGLNTGGNSLTISNTTVSATSGTSTVRFIGGATTNTITNSTILGAANASVATNGATIFFSTDANTANGNDNNTISNNNIGPVGANLPTKAILGNGSQTTTALGNSGITIDNNNIFDFFGAAVTSSGIVTNGGCNAWVISNNRFYQTGTRTWTTGAIHRAIDIGNASATSGAQNFAITGNIIGYASNTQTGTYVLTGSTGKFQAIQYNGITGAAATINNNTVANVTLSGVTSSGTSTASPFIGILVTNGLVTTNNNTIGSQSATSSLNFATTTTSATDAYGIYNFSVDNWPATGNNIGGISVANTGASGTFVIYGMRANTGTTVAFNGTSNNVGGTVADSIQLVATGTASQIIGMHTSNAAGNLLQNTVRNLTTNIGTGTTTTASVIGINVTTTSPSHTLAQNTIFNLNNTNTSAASVVTGIQFTGGTANVVERNRIYALSAATNSATAEVNGIRVAGGTTIYRNNMIAIGAGIANAIGATATNSGTTGVNGINEALGTNSFFHNSVYIGGAPTAGTGTSFAFNGSQTVNVRSFRDNIFFNARSNAGATGKNYAVKINGTTANPTGLTINNNVYFANGSGGVFGFFNSLDVADLSAWKTAVGQDGASFQVDPQFVDPTNSVPDLHLHPTNATVAEGNGADVGVTLDFDGQTRSGLTPTDIGADAGNFNGLDLSAPNIVYTPLAATSQTTDRVVTATITDLTGVAIGGSAPRVYFNKNAGSYFSTGCALFSGTAQNGVWNCTIDNTLIGGVATTDVIRYFVVAQDTLGNLSSNPSGGFSGTNVNTVTTPPTVPNQYAIVASFNGSYNVGTGETYTSLTNTGGVFEAINNGVLTGNVTINLTTDLTGETGTVALNQWAEDGAGNYTVLIKPSGGARQIVGSNTGALVKLNGADRVRIDGSTAASLVDNVVGGNPALRELTIQNTNVGTSAVVISVGSGTNGAQNNTIKNVNVLGQDPTTTLAGIALGGNTPGTTGTDNDGNRIENCSIKRSIYGIYSAGLSAANQNTGTVITQNDLSATATDRVRRIGIVLFNDDGAQITENSIATETNESSDAIGIGLGTQGIDTTTTTSGAITNALVARNKINGIASLSTTGFSAVGIAVAGGTTGPNTIVNNMITGVTAPSTSPDIPAGIFVAGVTGSSTRVYNNSVSMTGDRGTVASQTPSYGIAITGADPTVELKNNVFYTSQIASGGGAAAKSYAIGMVATTFVNLDSNYNDFWSTGANDGGFRSGSLTVSAGVDYADIAAWRTAVSDDTNSLEADPTFVDPLNNLHLITASPMTDAGFTIPSVTNDFDSELRVAPYEIGADEFPDVTAPDTQILTNPTNPSTSNSAAFTFSGTDSAVATVASFECKLDAGAFALCTSPQNYTGLSQGFHNFQVRAIDAAGNVDPTPASFSWLVDAIAPDTTLLSTPTDPSSSSTATFTFSGTDSLGSLQFECKLDADAFATCTSPKTYTGLADGSHTFQVRTKDSVGNVDPTPASFTWTISSIPTGPVAVSATAGTTGPTNYPTLKDAFDAINAGTHQGVLTVVVVQNTTETASAVLNASGTGSASYTSVSIQPIGGGARTVSGDIAGPLVDLNGADNVTIDGLNSGGNGLTFSNASQQVSASTIRFTNDATGNTVTNTTLAGSTGAALSSGFGVVYFATGTTTGNDNNTITGNTITAAGSALPINGVYSLGTSAAIDNSSNTISNNNISDYFNANSASSGINVNTGNSGWTISNNKLFQSGLRTYLTAATHSGISVLSGSGYTVTGNTIGFASSTGTGVYTMAGAVATRFSGIILSVGTAGDTSVQGNTVASIALATTSGAATTSGVLCGLNITSGNVNVGNVTPNTFGSTTGTGSLAVVSTTTQAAVVGINSGSTGAVVISNNTFGAFTSASPTAAVAGAVFGINVSGSATSMTITGNTIGNATADNMRSGVLGTTTGSSLAGGINQTVVPAVSNYSNNTIRNLSSYGTGTGGYVRGIQTGTALNTTAIPTISGNTITNLTTSGAVSGQTSANTSALGIQLISGTGASISGNTISNISNINAGAVGTVVAGITHASAINTTIANNVIFGLSNASTATSTTLPGAIAGVLVRSGTTNTTVQNNMIALGTGQATNTAIFGIWANHGSTPDPADRIYFNSVDIEGTVTSGAQPSAAFHRGDLTATAKTPAVDVRNNIFINNRSGGTGKHYAIANHIGATSNATGWTTVNNNALNAANPATVGFWTGDQTFAGWKAVSGGDSLSYSGIPVTFVNSASDLHLNMGLTATNLESAGATISGVTTDIDGQTRPGPTGSTNGGAFAPDLGADEFDGVYLDGAAPAITYSLFTNTSSTSNRTLVVGITDSTGVASGGNAPRVYFKKSTDPAFVSTACSLSSGTPQNGTYNCTLDYTLVGGGSVPAGTTVQYFVVAQDTAGNLSANPSAGFSGTNVNTVTTPPTTPNSYAVSIALNGTYTVGAGGAYTSLSNTGGLFEAINNGVVSGNTTFEITSDLTGETGTVALNAPVEEGTGGYTITIKPVGAARTITGSSTNSVIRLNGADNVVIDGSLTGGSATGVGGDNALRNLTVINTNTAATAGSVIAVVQGPNSANNVTIKNVAVSGQDPTQTLIGIHVGGNVIGSSPTVTPNTNIVIDNCSFQKSFIGIFNNGVSAALPATGSVISHNDLSATGANRLRRAGIFFFNQNGIQVTENKIGGIVADEAADAIGIIAGIQNVTATASASGGISNATISRNKIDVLTSTSTTGFSAVGIAIAGDPLGSNTISNNMITGVSAPSTSPDITAGIFVAGVAGSNTKVYANSVSLTGARGTVANQIGSYGIAISGVDPVVELKNNIFYTTQTSAGGTAAKSYAIGMTATTFANLDSNYNVFFSSGANAAGFRTGSLDTTGVDIATLAGWQTAVGDDANSVAVDPLFVSDINDLHLQATSPTSVLDSGTPLAAVAVDIDNQVRNTASPDIGADEFYVVALPGTLAFSAPTSSIGEGSGLASLTVSRTGGTNGTVGATYTLGGGTATGGASCTAGIDYLNAGGTVTFLDGETSKVITVQVCPDSITESNETFNATLSAPTGGATLGSLTTATVLINDLTGSTGDFDGDGKADLAILRTNTGSTSLWSLRESNGGVIRGYQWGLENDIATPADFDGDGKLDIAVWRAGAPTVAAFYILNSSNQTVRTEFFGQTGDNPVVVADYDGDGKADPAVYRDGAQSVFYYRGSLANPSGNVTFVPWGTTGDRPAVGDFDGNGKADFAINRGGQWWILADNGSSSVTTYGTGTDKLVPADYDGDGKTDIAVFRPSDTTWYILKSTTASSVQQQWGLATDILVPADYDGDGKTDIAVYRGGTWFVVSSLTNGFIIDYFGNPTDYPVANAKVTQ